MTMVAAEASFSSGGSRRGGRGAAGRMERRGASPRAQERRHRSGRSLAEGRAPPLPLANETISHPSPQVHPSLVCNNFYNLSE
jgi:hypothetical protein